MRLSIIISFVRMKKCLTQTKSTEMIPISILALTEGECKRETESYCNESDSGLFG